MYIISNLSLRQALLPLPSVTSPLLSLSFLSWSTVPRSTFLPPHWFLHIFFSPNFQNNTINNPDSPLPLPYSYPIPLTLSLSLISSCLIPCIGCGCISNLRVSSSPSPTPPTQPFSCPSHIASVDRFDSFSHSPLTSSSIHFILSLSIFFMCLSSSVFPIVDYYSLSADFHDSFLLSLFQCSFSFFRLLVLNSPSILVIGY